MYHEWKDWKTCGVMDWESCWNDSATELTKPCAAQVNTSLQILKITT